MLIERHRFCMHCVPFVLFGNARAYLHIKLQLRRFYHLKASKAKAIETTQIQTVINKVKLINLH